MGKGECESIRADARWAGAGIAATRQRIARWAAAAVFALAAAVALIAVVPEVGGPPSSASAAGYGWEGERGPEYPAIDDEFAADPADPTPSSVTVTLVDGESGRRFAVTTSTGSICLPTAEECGFSAAEGALFVGWSTDPAGRANVYAAGQMFPDNASHNAQLSGDATVYAVWLPQGTSEGHNTAYFYIRADGAIPFEPSGYSSALYIPSGSATSLEGSIRWPIAVTNNLEAVASNIQDAPSDQQIQEAMEAAGRTFDPRTQSVVWYVVKGRAAGAANTWNVDGVVMDKSAHLVIYEPNGGDSEVPPAQSYYQGESVPVNQDIRPNRFGYDFLGWAESPDALVPTYPAGQSSVFTMPGNQVVLYAVWRLSVVPVTYVAQPSGYGAVSPESNSVTALTGDGVTGSLATAVRGKVFEGWYQGNRLVTNNELLTVEATRANLLTERNVVLPTQFVARFADRNPQLSLSKAISNAPANGEYYVLGEVVEFSVTVTNTGNLALRQVEIADSLTQLPPIGDLAVGESRTLSYSHTVTDADVEEEAVRNVAVASGVIAGQATYKVTSNPATAAALAQKPPANASYVLYGAYPQAGGRVDISYEVVDAATAEGLRTVTATAQEGYEFQGWYRHDGELVSSQEALPPNLIKEALLDDGDARASYAPTLFLAYFAPKDAEGPDGPDNPDVPTHPDDPTSPGTPDGDSADGTGGDNVGQPASGGSSNAGPGSHSAVKTHYSASPMPRTGDYAGLYAVMIVTMAAAAIVTARIAWRKR